MKLAEIENEFNFTYPELYKQLEQDGMLDVGEYGPDWYTTVFPKLKDNPTLFLHTDDFELLNTDAVYKAIKELSDHDSYRPVKPEFKFIPFGQSGGGDYYCFFLTEQNEDDIPIVCVWDDSNEADYLAKNLQDHMFSVLLKDMSEQDTYNAVSDEDFRNNIENTLKTHTKYVTEQQTDILHTILSREITDYEVDLPKGRKEKYRGLLTDIELKKILKEVIPYEKTNETFEYADE